MAEKYRKGRKFLLLCESGTSYDLHTYRNLSEAFDKISTSKLTGVRTKIKRPLKTKKQVKAFLESVSVVCGPRIEDSISTLRSRIAQVLSLSVTVLRGRQEVLDASALLLSRLEDFIVSDSGRLDEFSLRELIKKPINLTEIASKDGLWVPKSSRTSLFLLEELYGWELGKLRGDFLSRLTEMYRSQSENIISTRSDEVFKQAILSLSDLPSEDATSGRSLLALRRILAILGKETDSQLLENKSKSGDILSLSHLWLSLYTKIIRHERMICIETPCPPFLITEIQECCERILNELNEELRDKCSLPFRIDMSGPRSQPKWFPSLSVQKAPKGKKKQDQSSEDKSEDTRRKRAALIDDCDLKIYRGIELDECEQALLQTYEECLADGDSELARASQTSRCKALDKLKREDEATNLLLDLSLERLETRAGGTFASLNKSRFEKIDKSESPSNWLKFLLIKALQAANRADFRGLTKILQETDKDEFSALAGESGVLVFKIRLAEILATLVHKSPDKAITKSVDLIARTQALPPSCREQVSLHMIQAALWSEKYHHYTKVRAYVDKELVEKAPKDLSVDQEALVVGYSYLEWLHANKAQRDEISKRWDLFQKELKNPDVWRVFQFVRPQLEFRRGFIRLHKEASRLAAVEHSRVTNRPVNLKLQNAREEISSEQWHSAFTEVYNGEIAALRASEWPAWTSFRKLRPRLWLKDGQKSLATFNFVQGGVDGPRGTFLTELTSEFSVNDLTDVLEDLKTLTSIPQKQRFYEFLQKVYQLLTTEERKWLISDAQKTMDEDFEFSEQVDSRKRLLDLVAKFYRCPSNTEEGLTLTKLFFALYKQSTDEFSRIEALRKLKDGFWTSMGFAMPERASLNFIEKLASESSATQNNQEKELLNRVLLAMCVDHQSSPQVKKKAEGKLALLKAEAQLSELAARTSTPTPQQISQAHERAIKLAQERIEKDLGSSWAHITANHIVDVAPFVQHMTLEQRSSLLTAFLNAVEDELTESTRRWGILQLLRDPSLYLDLDPLFERAKAVIWDNLEGRGASNEFDTHQQEVNSSHLTGFSFDPGHENRLLETVSQALGVVYGISQGTDSPRFFSYLSKCLFSGQRLILVNALICYFESGGDPIAEELEALIGGMLSSDVRDSRIYGLQVLTKLLQSGGSLDETLVEILRAFGKMKPDHVIRKELAKISRHVAKCKTTEKGFAFLRELNDELRMDPNPIIRKHAELGFWKN